MNLTYEQCKALKLCTKCGVLARGRYGSSCDPCNKKRYHDYYLANIDKYREKAILWKAANREKSLESKRKTNRKMRTEALDAYGWKCACCKEDTEQFLSIDHMNGGGGAHRREIGSSSIYSWLRKNKYPEGFQTLCHNCNMAKGFYGRCPHTVSV